MIGSTQLLALGGAAALIAGVVGGWTVRDWKADSAALTAAEAAIEERDRLQEQVDHYSNLYEQERADANPKDQARQQTIREIYRDVFVPGDCAVPDDARRVLDEAVAAANARASGQPRAGLPGAARATRAAD